MSNPSRLLALSGMLLFSLCTAPLARAAYEDPSGRVARLSQSEGEVSYSPAGEDQWIDVVRNRPLIRGDRLWTDRDARAEVQVGNAAIRLGSDTSFEILNLNDRIAQVRLTQGTLNLRVPRLYPGQSYEVATPTLAFTVTQAGNYRIDVDGNDDQTTIVVWDGAGEAYGDRSRFPLRAGDSVRFYSADLRDHEIYDLPRLDAFDRYSLDRDRRLDRSRSRRYVGDDVVGYADLDEYGRWRPVQGYGAVWFPSRVNSDWAPYRDGHWVWQEPWGWTWVDNAPWGFAPSHYGRWINVSGNWGWTPGPRNVRPVYAPALVAFVGGRNWSVSLSLGQQSAPIGWFPLAPREVYVPSYQASREYFTRVNVNNTVVNNTTITNVYNNNYGSGNTNVTQVNYANRSVAGAVTAVPSAVFVNAQPVRPAAIRIEGAAVNSGEITRIAPIAPTARSVLGPGAEARVRPPRETQDRRVFARNAPPPAERPFAAREPQLQQQPGQAPAPIAAQPDVKATQNVRVIAEQPGAVDARAAGPRRGEGRRGERAGDPGQPRPLERPAATASDPVRGRGERTPVDAQPPSASAPQAADPQQADRQRKAESDQRALEQQRLNDRQQQEQQRKNDADQRAVGEQRQRAEGQRKADSDQRAAEQQRLADKQQQEQRQLKADADQRAAEQQQAATRQQEQQRKNEADQRSAGDQRQRADAQRKAESDQRSADQQRLNDKQQQEQRQLKADAEQRAAEAQRKPGNDPGTAEQQRVAECQRQAREKHQDESQCGNPPPSGKRFGNRNRDKTAGTNADGTTTDRSNK